MRGIIGSQLLGCPAGYLFCWDRLFRIVVISLVSLVLFAAGCEEIPASPPNPAGGPVPGGSLNLGYTGSEMELDVHRTHQIYAAHYLILDTLLTRGPDGAYVGHLAKSWTVGEDGLSVELNLRPAVVFHDGARLSAEAVAQNLHRLRVESRESLIVPGLVREFLAALQETRVTGDLSLSLVFREPFPQVFHLLTLPYLAPMSPASFDSGNGVSGTGPYRLASQHGDGSYILERNQSYSWPPGFFVNQSSAYPSRIVFSQYGDDVRMLAAFREGLIDICHLPGFDLESEREPDSLEHIWYRPVVHYLAFNHDRPPWDSPDARRQVAGTLNRNRILDVLRSPAVVNASPLAPGVWGYNENLALGRLSAPEGELGEKSVQGIVNLQGSVSLIAFRGGDNAAVASEIASQIEALGLDVEISLLDASEMWQAVNKAEFDLALLSHKWDEASFLTRYFHSEGDLNRSGPRDPELDRLLDLLRVTVDPIKRLAILDQIQDLMVTQAVWVWLYSPLSVTVTRSELMGAGIAPWGQYWLHDSFLDQPGP